MPNRLLKTRISAKSLMKILSDRKEIAGTSKCAMYFSSDSKTRPTTRRRWLWRHCETPNVRQINNERVSTLSRQRASAATNGNRAIISDLMRKKHLLLWPMEKQCEKRSKYNEWNFSFRLQIKWKFHRFIQKRERNVKIANWMKVKFVKIK